MAKKMAKKMDKKWHKNGKKGMAKKWYKKIPGKKENGKKENGKKHSNFPQGKSAHAGRSPARCTWLFSRGHAPLVPPGKSFHLRFPQGKAFHTGICTLLVPPRAYWCARAESAPWGNKQGIPCGKQVYSTCGESLPLGEQARHTRAESIPLRKQAKVYPRGMRLACPLVQFGEYSA